MAIQFRPATRQGVPVLISIAGMSGSGKTYSALLMAAGLARSGKVFLIDTESGRGSLYITDERIKEALPGGYMTTELHPPFTSRAYVEAIDAAEKAGAEVIIIDSASHEWDGIGGAIEQAEAIEMRTGKPGVHCWNKVKAEHKKLKNKLLASRCDIILCLRAQDKVAQVKNAQGKTEIVSTGLQAICEKKLPFEMTLSFLLDEKTKIPLVTKCLEQLMPVCSQQKKIDKKLGEAIRAWKEQGVEINNDDRIIERKLKEAASAGTHALISEWKTLPPETQRRMVSLKDECKAIAQQADQMNTDIENLAVDPKDQSITLNIMGREEVFNDKGKALDRMLAVVKTLAESGDYEAVDHVINNNDAFMSILDINDCEYIIAAGGGKNV